MNKQSMMSVQSFAALFSTENSRGNERVMRERPKIALTNNLYSLCVLDMMSAEFIQTNEFITFFARLFNFYFNFFFYFAPIFPSDEKSFHVL